MNLCVEGSTHFVMRNFILILCIIAATHADLFKSKNRAIIVNPFYNPTSENDVKDEIKKMHGRPDPDSIVPPSYEQLIETSHLRYLIKSAVKSDSYAVGENAKSMVKPTQPALFEWLRNLLDLRSNKVSSANLADELEEQVGTDEKPTSPAPAPATDPKGRSDTNSTSIDKPTSAPIPAIDHKVSSDIKSNSIDSALMDKRNSKIAPKKVQREQLRIVSVEEDLTFPHGQNIESWVHIQGKPSDKLALIGVTNKSLILIAERNGVFEIVDELTFQMPVLCFTSYEYWNLTATSIQSVIVVAIENQLIFVSTKADFSGLHIIWTWTIQCNLKALVYFANKGSEKILLVNTPSTDNSVSADIYTFDLNKKHIWLAQKIPLEEPCESVGILDTYKESVLYFVQTNTVELYRTDTHSSSEKFHFHLKIDAKNVRTVSAFQMGGYSYLAMTGLEPKIFRYHRGTFTPQTILSRNWGLVEFIFPVPARTYRDDLILLVQHRIMMGTHSVSVVEALIWDGEAFDVALSIPCRIGDNVVDFGLSCLLDSERESGIAGLSVIQLGNSILLIIPRFKAPSSMFRMWFELKSFEHPEAFEMEKFATISKNVEMIIKYENDVLTSGNSTLARSVTNNGSRNDVNAVWNLTTVISDNLILNDGLPNVTEIYVGKEKWNATDFNYSVSDLINTLTYLETTVQELESMKHNRLPNVETSPTQLLEHANNGNFDLNSLQVLKKGNRLRRSDTPDVYVQKLKANKVNVERVNNIPFEDLVFTQNGTLNSVDTLVVEKGVKVLNAVESSNWKEVVGENTDDMLMSDNKIQPNNLHVHGNLNVETINGVVWKDFIAQVVMRNLPHLLNEVTVEGNIVAKADIEIDNLNEIKFPEEFLWMNDSELSIIEGHKHFKEQLTAIAIDSRTVDGITAEETVSLSNEQYFRGLTTFAQLEVTESLDVNGTINGKHLDDFKPNRSILEATIIESDCLFQSLEVEGPITITKHINGFVIDDILADVVYKTNPKTTITSFKTFESIESPDIELTSNLINDIHVQNYMTIDTDQDIQFDRLIGNVMIGQLYTNGLFDFINVTELDQNSIKLMGEQFTEAEIIFQGDEKMHFEAEHVDIQQRYNLLTVNDLLRIDESLEINGNFVINTALVRDLLISGQINGKPVINGISLTEFDKTRLSRVRPQEIVSKYYIENAIGSEIEGFYVNGRNIDELRKLVENVKNLPEFLTSSGVKLDSFVVDGNVMVDVINGHNFNSIRDNAIWLNKPNVINSSLEFLDSFYITKGIIAENVNNEVFANFLAGLVFKTDDNIAFTGRKIFQYDFHVDGSLDANLINGILPQNIWKKNSINEVTGQVNVIGHLFVENLSIGGYVNSVYLRNIEDKYNFNVDVQAHVLNNNIHITTPTVIQELRIQNGLNKVSNISEFLSKIILKNHTGMISGKKQFKNNAFFMNDLQMGFLDGAHVSTLLRNIVINEPNEKIIIVGDVSFQNDVEIPHIHVSGNMLATTVAGCSLSEWNANGLRTNLPLTIYKGLIFPAGTFRAADIALQLLDDHPMANIIALNREQDFLGHSFLSDLLSFSIINVGGLVNGHNIRDLLANSVLVTGDHHITAPTTFQSVRVLDVLQTIGTVNGKNLKNVASLNEDLYIDSPLSFRTISARGLNTKDHISGIDFNRWYANTLWKSQRETQIITVPWTVSNAIFRSSVTGRPTINEIPVKDLAEHIGGHHAGVVDHWEQFNNDYIQTCRKMAELIQKTRTASYFLSHFEVSFSMHETNIINSVHFFNANGNSYLVINLRCTTIVYIWNRNSESYQTVCETETGNVNDWIDVLDELNVIHLISNTKEERSNCLTSGVNIWKFDGSTLVHLSKMRESNKFSFLHATKSHPQRFLALTQDKKRVNEFDLDNNLLEEWHLPIDDQEFRFLPENANLGLALSNGKQLSVLSSTKSVPPILNRNERSTNPFAGAVGKNVDSSRCPLIDQQFLNFTKNCGLLQQGKLKSPDSIKFPLRCPLMDKLFKNLTENCDFLKQAKLKAFSNIGPFENLRPATGIRLLKDYMMARTKQINTAGRGPQIGSSFTPILGSSSLGIAKNGDPEARDAFGGIKSAAIKLADDGLVGSTAKNRSQPVPKPDSDSKARDAFGKIESAAIKLAGDGLVGSTAKNRSQPVPKPDSDSKARDAFGKIESAAIKLADDGLIGSTSKNGSQAVPKPDSDSKARDTFGEIESAAIEATDDVIDTLIDVDTEEDNSDFDDSLIGSAKNQSQEIPKADGDSKARDAFGEIESAAIKLADDGLIGSTAKNGSQAVPKPDSDSKARDTFGEIESAAIEATDDVIDTLIDVDTEEDNSDFDDSLIGSAKNQSQEIPKADGDSKARDAFGEIESAAIKLADDGLIGSMAKNGSQAVPKPDSDSKARDTFGEIESAAIEATDDVIDSLIDLDTEEENTDFDESSVGSSMVNHSQGLSESNATNSNSTNVTSQVASSRDTFGEIEATTIKFVDGVIDVFGNIKDKFEESKEKFEKLYPRPEDNAHIEDHPEEKKSVSKNLPKIPQVDYSSSRITDSMGTHANDSVATSTTTSTVSPYVQDLGNEELKISKEISSEGIASAENFNFPSHPAEEIVAVAVGENQRHLIAVSSLKEHTIQGKHDLIRIYEDIIEGKLFQTIICHRPRSLTVLNIRDESILAFIENDIELQIYVYRGIQGFIKFTSLVLPSYVFKLTSIHLPVSDSFACSKPYLAATMKKEILFIEAKLNGYCGVNADLNCS